VVCTLNEGRKHPLVRAYAVDSAEGGQAIIEDDTDVWDEMHIEWRDVPPWKPLPVTGAGA